MATKCPVPNAGEENVDPYSKYSFWNINLTEKFSTDLNQFPLGRRFLYQSGLLRQKRVRTESPATRKVKRKRTK